MHSKEQIIEFANEWVGRQCMFADSVSALENALSAITGFNKSYDGYDGQEEDVNKLVDKLNQYPKLSIEFYGHVLNDNEPWRFQELFSGMYGKN